MARDFLNAGLNPFINELFCSPDVAPKPHKLGTAFVEPGVFRPGLALLDSYFFKVSKHLVLC